MAGNVNVPMGADYAGTPLSHQVSEARN